MSSKTKIEWCDATWNPITGCAPVSAGCEHCYAKRMAERFPHIHGVAENPEPFNQIQFHPDRLDTPLHWRKPKRIFVCSMGDIFHAGVLPQWLANVLSIMGRTPQHTYIILTKRPERALEMFWQAKPVLDNLWLGVTAENQEMADKRIPILLQIPAAKRFVSVEPMLGPVDLSYPLNGGPEQNGYGEWMQTFPPLDWEICGPETGPGARPMNLDWARSLRDQCVAVGVPFFYKRGELDGQLWHQFPGEEEK